MEYEIFPYEGGWRVEYNAKWLYFDTLTDALAFTAGLEV